MRVKPESNDVTGLQKLLTSAWFIFNSLSNLSYVYSLCSYVELSVSSLRMCQFKLPLLNTVYNKVVCPINKYVASMNGFILFIQLRLGL